MRDKPGMNTQYPTRNIRNEHPIPNTEHPMTKGKQETLDFGLWTLDSSPFLPKT